MRFFVSWLVVLALAGVAQAQPAPDTAVDTDPTVGTDAVDTDTNVDPNVDTNVDTNVEGNVDTNVGPSSDSDSNAADSAHVASSSVPTPEPSPERLGPMRLDIGGSQLRLGGLAQLTSEIETRDHETDGFVDFRRLRVDVRLTFLDGRVGLRGHLSTMPRGAELLDLYVDARLHEHALLRVGVAKTPFTAYRQQSINDHVLVDWPIVSRWFGGERQLGITLEGTPGGASYAVGVYNGDASRPQNQRFSTAYGEWAPTRSGFRNATAYDVPHPELMARGGLAFGPLHTGLSVAWDVRPDHAIDTTARFALETQLDTELVDMWLIGYLALQNDLHDDLGLGLGGVLVDTAFRVHHRVELAARWSSVTFADDLRRDARATVDERIAASSGDDQARLTERYRDVGQVRALHEATAGLAVYFRGHNLKWQTDVSWLREAFVHGHDDGFRLRLQAQLAF